MTCPEPMRSCTLAPILAGLDPADDWRSANLARAAAAADPFRPSRYDLRDRHVDR